MKSAKILPLVLLGFAFTIAQGQNYIFSNDIPVTANGQPLKAAWAGGLNAPQLSAVDMDNDGRLDLVAFDRVGPRLLTFRNQGSTGQVDYAFAPAFMDLFPAGLKDWLLCRDFDNDGFVDLFTAVPQVSNVKVYRNTSANTGGTLSFALFADTLMTFYPPSLPLYMSKSDIPAIDDIDGDGDLDILTFQIGGQKVEWHRNMSIENTGGLMGMDFIVQSHCFGHFEEDAFSCTAIIGEVPCGTGQRNGDDPSTLAKPTVHAGSTTLSLDLNNDGLKDLLIGDIGCPTLYALVNGGNAQIANFISVEADYPANDSSVFVTSFPAAYYLDLDNDGIKDLVTAPNNTSQIEDVRGVMLHKNIGTNAQPQFNFQRFGVLQEEMIDIGSAASPCLLDYNDDGLLDLLVGGAGRYDSLSGFSPRLQLFANSGTAQQPAFTLVSENYLNLSSEPSLVGKSWIKPAAGDLDNDGDDDLLLGCSDGTLLYYFNAAAPGSPAAFTLSSSNYAAIDVGFNSAPYLFDLDHDGDRDLLIGNHRGYIHYYDNAGTPSLPSFVLADDTFGNVKVNDFTGQVFSNGYAQPAVLDFDGDGTDDLLIGGIDGEVQVYPSITLVPGATFTRSNNLFGKDFGLYASMAAAVLDSARLSYVVGDYRGGLMMLRYGGPVSAPSPGVEPAPLIQLFPNPANERVHYTVSGLKQGDLTDYVCHDGLGRCVLQGRLHRTEGEIETASLAPGVYFLSFLGKGHHLTRKLSVIRD